MRRVVVTGLGMISPLGTGRINNWAGMLDGRSGISYISRFDATPGGVRIAGEARDFDPIRFFLPRERRRLDRFLQLAVAASQMALEDAHLEILESIADRAGVYIGTGVGGLNAIEEASEKLRSAGPRKVSPLSIPRMLANLAPGNVSIRFGLKGPTLSHVSACASGTHSIGEAFRAIKWDLADVMLAGGSEAAITPLAISGFTAMRALTRYSGDPREASRPFERDRRGFVLGEGAGILVLESLEHARSRGAEIYCEIVGYGLTSDAHHVTLPVPGGDGAARAMRLGLKEAQVNPEEIEYINAHGTGTKHNDAVETQAIKKVFGHLAPTLWVSSIKSMTGHLLGASGAIEAAASALTLREGSVPPTINYVHPDPECDLDYVPNVARARNIGYALSNSFGFGGMNATLVLKRFSG